VSPQQTTSPGLKADLDIAGSEYAQQDLCTSIQAVFFRLTRHPSGLTQRNVRMAVEPLAEHVEGGVTPTPVWR